MDTLEKQKERNYLLEKRDKVRRQLFPIRVALYGVIAIGLVLGFKNNLFYDGKFLRLAILVAILLGLTYIIEAIRGRYKNK